MKCLLIMLHQKLSRYDHLQIQEKKSNYKARNLAAILNCTAKPDVFRTFQAMRALMGKMSERMPFEFLNHVY